VREDIMFQTINTADRIELTHKFFTLYTLKYFYYKIDAAGKPRELTDYPQLVAEFIQLTRYSAEAARLHAGASYHWLYKSAIRGTGSRYPSPTLYHLPN
jgi:hypothetical protein